MSFVLAVEPDDTQVKLLRGLVSGPDTELVVVVSPRAALDAINRRMPDLVLLSESLGSKNQPVIDRLRTLPDRGEREDPHHPFAQHDGSRSVRGRSDVVPAAGERLQKPKTRRSRRGSRRRCTKRTSRCSRPTPKPAWPPSSNAFDANRRNSAPRSSRGSRRRARRNGAPRWRPRASRRQKKRARH